VGEKSNILAADFLALFIMAAAAATSLVILL
jgi:hypothetical protein